LTFIIYPYSSRSGINLLLTLAVRARGFNLQRPPPIASLGAGEATMQVLFAAGLPKVIRVTTISAHQGHPRKAIVKTEVGTVMRAAVVVAMGVAVALCAVYSLGTGFIVLWSQSVAGSGVRWWR
jgi:hypothetical protein